MSSKTTYIRNPALFSGSTDLFRTAFGGYYTSEDTDNGTVDSFSPTSLETPLNNIFDKVYYEQGQTVVEYNNLIPNYTVPVRVASDSTDIGSDQEWAAYIRGGQFGERSYTAKVSDAQHEYVNISYDMPYSKYEANVLEQNSITDIVEVGYDYRDYLSQYQGNITDFETEMYIPNYYILSDLYRSVDEPEENISKLYSSRLLSMVSFEGKYTMPQKVFDFNSSKIPYAVPSDVINSFTDIRQRNTDLRLSYLTSSTFTAPSGSDVVEWARNKQKTFVFDNDAISNKDSQDPYENCLPFNMKIQFPKRESGEFVENYISTGFDSKLLAFLNNTFTTEQGITPETKSYSRYTQYMTNEEGILTDNNEVITENYKEINYIDFLTYCRDEYTNTNGDMVFVGGANLNRLAALDTNGIYRHVNTSVTVQALSYAINFLNDTSRTGLEDWDALYGGKNNYRETIAYRIEKIGGPPAGDGLTQNVLQNYWFLNSSESEIFSFFDNQVKNNKDYTYNVYAYVLCSGVKYQYTDLLLTKDLGCDIEDTYGLEFYNPDITSYNRENRLFSGSVSNGFDDSAGGTYGTEAQIYSPHKYLADFYLKYEPCLKLVEIPMYSKTLRILDNPPNVLTVTPYQTLDNTQTICFDLRNNSFNQRNYPSTITSDDEQIKERYLNANDLTETNKVLKQTKSNPSFIQVFRTTTKPTSMSDFDGNLIDTIDLTIDNVRFYTKEYIKYDNQVRTNQKYYYTFRSVNQNGVPGHLTEIYEVELINDGGYKFAIFDTILESDLGVENPIKPSTEVKKIFQLEPALEHLTLDTTDVDFNQSAESQIKNIKVGSADDSIWDKTFKVRLTSKKTGKKLDLNITYKIGSE